jgi:hypothetical protein
MNAGDLVCALLLAGLGAFRLAQARQAWRGPARVAGRPPPDPLLRPFGGQAARGAVRAVAAQVVILLAAAWLLAALAVASAISGPAASAIRAIGGVVGVAGVLFGTVTGLMILLFNRPRFLVPPSARQDKGVLAGR